MRNKEQPVPDLESEFERPSIEELANETFLTRTKLLMKDKDMQEALVATFRAFANIGISIADAAPAVGAPFSGGADLAKIFARITGLPLDLTPDVSIKLAVGSEVAEIPAAGAAPTHAIETLKQMFHDRHKLAGGYKAMRHYYKRLSENPETAEIDAEINEAAEVFLDNQE
ncbi:hypothetical protein ACFL2B_01125 [Patescibacteria group bacterium]